MGVVRGPHARARMSPPVACRAGADGLEGLDPPDLFRRHLAWAASCATSLLWIAGTRSLRVLEAATDPGGESAPLGSLLVRRGDRGLAPDVLRGLAGVSFYGQAQVNRLAQGIEENELDDAAQYDGQGNHYAPY